MVKVSFLLGLTAGLCLFTSSAFAQELILEETEDGYIIENWEDTGVETQEPNPNNNDEVIIVEPEPIVTTSPTGTSVKKSKTVTRKTYSSTGGSVKSGAGSKVGASISYGK